MWPGFSSSCPQSSEHRRGAPPCRFLTPLRRDFNKVSQATRTRAPVPRFCLAWLGVSAASHPGVSCTGHCLVPPGRCPKGLFHKGARAWECLSVQGPVRTAGRPGGGRTRPGWTVSDEFSLLHCASRPEDKVVIAKGSQSLVSSVPSHPVTVEAESWPR